MTALFYIAATIAVIATAMVITAYNAIHALLYLNVSLVSVSVIFFIIGAPFIAALEVIVYAGAIMVLFVFVIMMLKEGPAAVRQEKLLLKPRMFIFPVLLSTILLVEIIIVIISRDEQALAGTIITPKMLAIHLFGPYVIAVEQASFLLLAGLIGAHHIGRGRKRK